MTGFGKTHKNYFFEFLVSNERACSVESLKPKSCSLPLQRYGCCKNHFCISLISLYMKTCSIALLLVFPNLVTYYVFLSTHIPPVSPRLTIANQVLLGIGVAIAVFAIAVFGVSFLIAMSVKGNNSFCHSTAILWS